MQLTTTTCCNLQQQFANNDLLHMYVCIDIYIYIYICVYTYTCTYIHRGRAYIGAQPRRPGSIMYCFVVYTLCIYIYICIGNPSLFDLGEISAFEAGPRLEINVFMYVPLRPIHLLRVFPLRVLAARFGGRHFCHRMNLRVSSRGYLQGARIENS